MKTKLWFLIVVLSMAVVAAAGVAWLGMRQTLAAQPSLVQSNPAGSGSNVFRLSMGSTLTLTSVSGGFRTVGGGANGTASGVLVFKVTGVYRDGYTLSLAGGTLNLNGTTYTLTSGSAQLGVHLKAFVGQGSLTTGSAQLSMLFGAKRAAAINGEPFYVVHLDLQGDGGEVLVTLLASANFS